MGQTPMTKAVYLMWVRDRYDKKIEADIRRAREARNVKQVMREVREGQFRRDVADADAQRERDIRNPPSQQELDRSRAADSRVARSLPSVPTGRLGRR